MQGMVLLSTALGQGSVLCIISVASALLLSLGFLVLPGEQAGQLIALVVATLW